jgi:hypothetical protein
MRAINFSLNSIKLFFVASALIAFLFIAAPFSSAVGIKWYTESEYVSESSEKCILYGAYNPSPRDIKVDVAITGSLADIITGSVTEETIVKAQTPSKEAEPINFCFKVENVYVDNCLIGDYLCEQKCAGEQTKYSGEVILTETPISTSIGATGSGVSIAASAPLELIVSCNPYPRDWTPAYAIGIVAVILGLGITIYNRERKINKTNRR